jgi:hypothetical protein
MLLISVKSIFLYPLFDENTKASHYKRISIYADMAERLIAAAALRLFLGEPGDDDDAHDRNSQPEDKPLHRLQKRKLGELGRIAGESKENRADQDTDYAISK